MKAGILVPLWSELVRTMICSKRLLVVSSLVAYLLATTSVQALHDHSSAAHHCSCCGGINEFGVAPESRGECCAEHADGESGRSHHHSGSKSCDESCFACRLLAVKGVAPTAFAVAPHITAVFQVEQTARSFFPHYRPSQPLSRGPPCS